MPPPCLNENNENVDGVTIARQKQQPIRLGQVKKRDVSTQFGALCYRVRNDRAQILLVTSRGTGRWIIPKGWPMDKTTPAETALREAFEEAGVEGKSLPVCLGIYCYHKKLGESETLPCVVATFPVKVRRLLKNYPEAADRKRQWFSPKKAAGLVMEPELAAMIRYFDPVGLPK